MNKILFILLLFQDVRVATFSTGKPDTPSYESLSFWVKSNKRAYIRYAHGKDADDIELSYKGSDSTNGKSALTAGFPNNSNYFHIVLSGDTLFVSDKTNKFHKPYLWENEGISPTDSISKCDICAQDAQEAMEIVRTYFLK